MAAALFRNMKAHPAFLALSVLCLGNAAWPHAAWAQTPAPAAELQPAPLPPPPPPPAPPPPTPVDGAPPTPVNGPAGGVEAPGGQGAEGPSAAAPAAPPPAASLTPPLAPVATPAAPTPAPARRSTSVELPPSTRGLGAPRLRDAHHDRIVITPTAETNPKGSFYVTSYEIVLLQMGYSVTDNTQISITATPPLEGGVIPGDISVKTVVLREPHVSVAAIASASGIVGFEELSGFLGRAGGAVTLCADARECRLGFSLGSSIALAGPASIWFNGVGLNFRAGKIVSIIAELDTLVPMSEPVGEANGVLGAVGVRLSGPAWGVDLALLKAGKARAEPSPILPFIAATYRYVP